MFPLQASPAPVVVNTESLDTSPYVSDVFIYVLHLAKKYIIAEYCSVIIYRIQ